MLGRGTERARKARPRSVRANEGAFCFATSRNDGHASGVVYRQAPDEQWTWRVDAVVRAPFGAVVMSGNVRAFDAEAAVKTFAALLKRDGFEPVGDARATVTIP